MLTTAAAAAISNREIMVCGGDQLDTEVGGYDIRFDFISLLARLINIMSITKTPATDQSTV
jgi:hypothetical protein